MRYEIPFVWFGDSAKNVGVIPNYTPRDDVGDVVWVALDANTDGAAYAAIVKAFSDTDRKKRPVSGRSYVRRWRAEDVTLNNGRAPLNKLPLFKVGDRVLLHRPHAAASSDDGKGYRRGVIDEVLGASRYGIKLDGYPNIADFTIREFVKEPA